jgi:broad specificity phosphatase PhoE
VTFAPRLPLPAERDAWQQAAAAADQFWSRAANDARISDQFRAICSDNLRTVRMTAELLGGQGEIKSLL